jgi:uncharacterized protein YjbJ (UPF0337 family)
VLRRAEARGLQKVLALIPQDQTARAEEDMKSSAEDKIAGNFHEAKGAIKEEVGKVINNHEMKVEGKIEKNSGKIQQKVGDAKEKLADLKGKFTESKKS